jgi:hypothetical protein
MDPLTIGLLGSTAISGGLSLFGANQQAQATKDAAKQQQMMQMLALQQQQQQYQQNRADLAPYRGFGETAGNQLIDRLPELTQGFNPTQADLGEDAGISIQSATGAEGNAELGSSEGARCIRAPP